MLRPMVGKNSWVHTASRYATLAGSVPFAVRFRPGCAYARVVVVSCWYRVAITGPITMPATLIATTRLSAIRPTRPYRHATSIVPANAPRTGIAVAAAAIPAAAAANT